MIVHCIDFGPLPIVCAGQVVTTGQKANDGETLEEQTKNGVQRPATKNKQTKMNAHEMPHCLSLQINFDVIRNAQIIITYLRQELALPLEHGHLSIRHFCPINFQVKIN